MFKWVVIGLLAVCTLAAETGLAATMRVPQEQPMIQAWINAPMNSDIEYQSVIEPQGRAK